MNIREKILVVEDEKSIAQFIAAVLDGQGYETIQARTGQEGLSMISSHCPDLVILDLGLPDMDGLDIVSGSDIYEFVLWLLFVLSDRHRIYKKI